MNEFNYFLADSYDYSRFWEKNLEKCTFFNRQIEIYGTELLKIGRFSKKLVKRKYIFTQDSIYYLKKGNTIEKAEGYKHLHECVLSNPTSSLAPFGFSLKQNHKSIDLFCTDKASYDKVMEILRTKCILLTWKEDFEILKTIGRGSFANVYMVRSKENNKLFAAKRLSKAILQKDIKGFASVHNEIHILRNLNHHRIIKIYQIYEEADTLFIIMQLTKGDLLKRMQRFNNITFLEIKLLMSNLLETLVYFRNERILHRDIKLENLFIRDQNSPIFEILLGDFGFATQFFEDINPSEIVFHKCGTPGYVAPEIYAYQKGSKLYDSSCDLFSVGAVFYYLLFKTDLFRGNGKEEVIKKNIECSINYNSKMFQGLDENSNLLKGMLQSDPSLRINLNNCLDTLCNISDECFFQRKHFYSGDYDQLMSVGHTRKSAFTNSTASKYGSFVVGRRISYCTSDDLDIIPNFSSKNESDSKEENSTPHQEESKESFKSK